MVAADAPDLLRHELLPGLESEPHALERTLWRRRWIESTTIGLLRIVLEPDD
jgi:hypothetical protein